MAMNVLQSPSRPGLGKVSGFFWRNPGLGLFLLLLGPLMWFGIVYFGSLLTLLWQGFYTFDDFTMSVTPELTLALSLPSHSHWAILSSRSWLARQDILSAIWFIPSRGRLAICRWRRHSPWCRLFLSHCTWRS